MPKLWRTAITKVICKVLINNPLDCDDIENCQTLTKLSSFIQNGENIEISYTDELGIKHTKSFGFPQLIDNSMNNVYPNCLSNIEDWENMTYLEKVQTIIDHKCDCCENGEGR